jgi:hypothetical protein
MFLSPIPMKLQIPAACLLCLIIVGGSLDSLPDPPAVRPQRNPNNFMSRFEHHIPVAMKYHAFDGPTYVPHFQACLFSIEKILETRSPSRKPIFVRRATDTSPPNFS